MQQGCLAVQRQAILILRGDAPGQRRFGKQSLGNNARRCRRRLDAAVAAWAGVLDPLVLDHADLLRHDVELFADLDANLDQSLAIKGADAFRFG
ncbi:hypothetical protein D3C72_1250800 [compost metagenome]